CAVPFATAVTTPVEETVAMEVASLVQVNVATGMALPPESKAVATSDAVAPRLASEALEPPPEAATETLAGTCETVTPSEPLTPFEVALMAAFPFASEVTKPALETPATGGAPLDHVKVTLA